MLLIIADEARRHYGRELCSRLWDEDNVRRRTLWGLFDSLKNMITPEILRKLVEGLR